LRRFSCWYCVWILLHLNKLFVGETAGPVLKQI
jgi:hypothetical protein